MPITLNTVVDDITSVPEAYRNQYQRNGDKFVLQKVEIPDSADLNGIIKNRDEILAEKKRLEERYKGIDPEKYQQMTAAQQDAERARLESKGQWDALAAQLKEKQAEELRNKDAEIGSLTSALERTLVDREASTAITAAKGNSTLLLPHVKQYIKIFKEDGKFIAKVVDGNGNPRIGDAKGTPMTISQLVEEMRSNDAYGRAFEASFARGTGAPANGGRQRTGVVTITRAAFNTLGAAERSEHFKNGGVVID